MSKSLPVNYNGNIYYNIEIRDSFDDLCPMLLKLGYSSSTKIMVVSDSNVSELYLDELKKALDRSFDVIADHIFEAGEQNKNLSTVSKLYEALIENHFERRDILIALGGGVVGDLTGFAAATYLRGVDFIQLPTTLLSQVDSSIGGKTGVDCMQYKNMVGAFYMPKLVYMNLSVLKTLPPEQFSSGMAEIIKHGMIKDRTYYEWIASHSESINSLDPDALEHMISRSCEIKRSVVEEDPTEKGIRAVLNFGHTIGHAIEKLSDFSMFHGQCVAIGCVAATLISKSTGKNISENDVADMYDVFRKFDLPVNISGGLTVDEIFETTRSDKKMEAGKIKFILLNSLGDAYIEYDLSESQIKNAINAIIA